MPIHTSTRAVAITVCAALAVAALGGCSTKTTPAAAVPVPSSPSAVTATTPAVAPSTAPAVTTTAPAVTPSTAPAVATPTVKPSPTGAAPPGNGAALAPGLPPPPPAYLALPTTAQRNAVKQSLISYDQYRYAFENLLRIGPNRSAPVLRKHASTLVVNDLIVNYTPNWEYGDRTLPGHASVLRFLPLSATPTKTKTLICLSAVPLIADRNKKLISTQLPGREKGFVVVMQYSNPNWLLISTDQPAKGEPTCA